MDPARSQRFGRSGSQGGNLRPPTILIALTAACTSIPSGPGGVVAIELDGLAQRSLEEGDTLSLMARAVDAGNNPIADADIIWETLDVDSGQVGFTIDGTSGLVSALSPGMGRVQARVGSLRSGIVTVTVTPAPDSIGLSGDSPITLAVGATTSPNLSTMVYDLTTVPDSQIALLGKPVHFSVTVPTPGGVETEGFFLTQTDTVPGSTPHQFIATTDGSGLAFVVIRRVSGSTVPDSAVVQAVGLTARGDTVPGSPIRFVVDFQSNP